MHRRVSDMATAHKDVSGTLEGKATRFGYSDGLLILGKEDPRVFVLDADLAKSTTSERFKKEFPDRFIDLSLIHISEPTRLGMISYAVFCLKKKKKKTSE